MNHIEAYFFLRCTALLSGTTTLLTFCYFGKMATDSYEQMADAFYESNWQNFPVKLQKYFILCIAFAQETACYHGFGVFVLNLETFKTVLILLRFFLSK